MTHAGAVRRRVSSGNYLCRPGTHRVATMGKARPLERHYKSATYMTVKERESAYTPPPAERRHTERRTRVLRALVYGGLHPRRRAPRRIDDRAVVGVDWHHPQWLAVAVLIVLLCCADVFLTLELMQHGAYEVNPFMAPLVGHSASAFALVKIGVTALGVLLLTQLARVRAFGRIPVGVFLYSVLAIYAALVLYEVRLLDRL